MEVNADGNYNDFVKFGYDSRVAMRRNQEPLKEKFPQLSSFSAYGSNPIFFKDPDGYYLKGNNGEAVTYKLSDDGCATWSKNATDDVMRLGNAMLRNQVGKAELDNMIQAKYPINVLITQDIRNKYAEINYKFKGKTLKVKSAELIIFEGSIHKAKEIVDSGQYFESERGLLYTEFLEDGDIEAIIGSNGVHEGSHLDERNIQENNINIQLQKTNTPAQFDVEKSPIENEIKYLKELKK